MLSFKSTSLSSGDALIDQLRNLSIGLILREFMMYPQTLSLLSCLLLLLLQCHL